MNPAARSPGGPRASRAFCGILLAGIVATIAICGCSRTSGAIASASAPAVPVRPPTVELSASKAGELLIAPVGTHRFRIEKSELGSVAFAEDPAIVQAESTLLGAAATVKLNRKELRRARLLYDSQGVSAREVEQASSDEQTAAAALAAARVALRVLGKSDAQIDRMIVTGHIDAPAAASAGRQWVEADVSEADTPLIRPGQAVGVAVTALPGKTFTGRVYRIYATVDPSLHRQRVRCAVSDPARELRPGMLASITIELRRPMDALAIPADGVVRESDGTLTAWVTADRRHFSQRVIATGLREGGEVQILGGLQRGELVVTRGAIYLDNMINAAPSD